jgi:PEP-CTERM motif
MSKCFKSFQTAILVFLAFTLGVGFSFDGFSLVPEPAAYILFGTGLVVVGLIASRSRRNNVS